MDVFIIICYDSIYYNIDKNNNINKLAFYTCLLL